MNLQVGAVTCRVPLTFKTPDQGSVGPKVSLKQHIGNVLVTLFKCLKLGGGGGARESLSTDI